MDAEGLHINIEYFSNSGIVLSPEQKAALQISLPILQSDHKLKRVKLWGKIQGIKADYFVAHGVGVDELQDRKAVYRCLFYLSILIFSVTIFRNQMAALPYYLIVK